MAAPSFETLGAFATAYRVFDLPFAFRDIFAVQRFQGRVAADLGSSVTRNGLTVLGFWQQGFRQMTAKQPLVWPRDAAGLKFRRDDDASATDMAVLLKATTQSVPEDNVLVALKSGRIEAQISSWERLQTDQTLSVQAGVTETNHSFQGYQLVVSSNWWNGLDPVLAKSLRELIARVSQQANFEAVRRQTGSKRTIMRSGAVVRTLTRKQRQAWQQVATPIWNRFADAGHQPLIDAVRAANATP